MFNGDEYENIELKHSDNIPKNGNGNPIMILPERDIDNNEYRRESQEKPSGIVITDTESQADTSQGDIMREMVKNKELMRTRKREMLQKFGSVESEMSEASTLVSTSSDIIDDHRRRRINHHTIRSVVSDSEMEPPQVKDFPVFLVFVVLFMLSLPGFWIYFQHECLFC